MPDLWEAKGHVAKIVRFDKATCLLPLNEDEARYLLGALQTRIELLVGTGDFPEREAYFRLKQNIQSVWWMLVTK